MYPKKICLTITIILLICQITVQAQRAFVTKIGVVNRGYLYEAVNDKSGAQTNLPLVVLIPGKGQQARDFFGTQADWKGVEKTVAVLFPNPGRNRWQCDDSTNLTNDLEFLKQIIDETYNNFHVNRNKVFLVADEENNCILDHFQKRFPALHVRNVVIGKTQSADRSSYVMRINQLLSATQSTPKNFPLWNDPFAPKRMNPIDSVKEFSWHGRIVMEIRTGGFLMNNSVKTGITDKTYMDISKANGMLGLHVTKWFNDSMGWFVDITRLKIPTKQEISGDKIKTGGGIVVPISLGFKYAIPGKRYRPYVSLATGVIPVIIFGGKMRVTSMSAGPPTSRPSSIKSELRTVLHTTLGTGVDWRFSKRLVFGAHLRYIHSANFETAGNVDGIRGFNLNVSAGYILNANSIRYLSFLRK